jgi:hypothetical protein
VATRGAVHALVDDLDDAKLNLAEQALLEILDQAFDLTDEEERELLEREAECARGEMVNARRFLAELRRGEHDNSDD